MKTTQNSLRFTNPLIVCQLLAVILLLAPIPSRAAGPSNTSANRAVLRAHPEDIVILQLQDGADRDKIDSMLDEIHGTPLYTVKMGSTSFLYVQSERGRAPELLKKIQKSSDVTRAEQNRAYPAAQASSEPPNDPDFSQQWDLSIMQWSQGRALGLEPNTARTFWVIDSGLSPIPGELGQVAVQYDFSDVSVPGGPIETPWPVTGHGTSVCTVAAATDNHFGMAGAANFEGNRIAIGMLRVDAPNSTGTTANFINAMSFLYNSNVSVGPVNLSRESIPPAFLNADPMLQAAALQLKQKGFLVVLAAGNYSTYDPSPELNMRRVAACQQDGTIASFSNTGPFTAMAPGANTPVYNPLSPGVVFTESGTSFAAPRWCTAIMHVMSCLPSSQRTAVNADQIVFNTASATPQGMRIPNLQAAITAAIGQQQSSTPSPSPSPGAGQVSQPIQYSPAMPRD
jgi:hypothetical protein